MELSNINYPDLVKARLGNKEIRYIDQHTLKNECASIIARAFTYSTPNGQTSSEILAFQSIELFNALKGRYLTLTIQEVQQAFKKGLDNEYGQYFGMCAKTYNQFLKGYFDNPERGKAWNAYLDGLGQPKIALVPTHIQKQQGIGYLKNRFENYKKTGQMGYFAWVDYDFLKELKGVKSLITLDQFKVIKQKTEEVWSEKYVKEMEKEKKRGNFDLANAIADILTKGIEKDRTLINRQKELALKAYFDSVDSLDL